ncbi:LOW QUALITY PROTEIN: bestrophin-4 [Rhynchonycteris naso]
MTVSYTLKVAEARFGGFSGLLLHWRGSIYKLLYKEFLLFTVLYALLSITYRLHLTFPRLLLSQEQRHVYAQVARYCNLIPLSFVLGFYVTLVVNRWWVQYTSIPLPDQLMCVISASVHGLDQHGHVLRSTLVRCANLASVLVLGSVNTRVLKRFPAGEHVVDAGFMSQEERKKFESLKSDFNKYCPCVWFTNLAAQARRDGRIHNDITLCLLLEELNKYRAKCSMLFHYDWISIPLVYTQVVTTAVYSFFGLSLVGRQFVEPEAGATPRKPLEPGQEPGPVLGVGMYVPLTTLLQFFYAGWHKVAEQIINPFGEDDNDFETNQLIDSNLQVSLLSMDNMYQNLPPAEKDVYWDEGSAQPPYTVATVAESLRPSFLGTFNLRVSKDQQNLQVEASPRLARPVPAAQSPLLSSVRGAGGPSHAVSLSNLDSSRGPTPTHLLWSEDCDPGAADCIKASASSGNQA